MDASTLMLESVRVTGWVLLHFLWQAGVVGLMYAVFRSLLPRGEWRYRFGMGALMALAICPALTAWRLLDAAPLAGQVVSNTVMLVAPGSSAATGAEPGWLQLLEAVLPWLVLMWSAGVLALSLRAWQQWRRLKLLVSIAEQAPVWQARLDKMAGRFGLHRRVAVLRSKLVLTPVLVGWIRPVILLPLAVACEFPLTQVELILAHELAHLKRWDPVANLFQVILETLHFYHPVVHWISRDVRNEREICCDQLALATTGGSRHEFAATLARLGELREQPSSLLLAANGGVLLDRVQYMVMHRAQGVRRRPTARLLPVVLGVLMITLALGFEWNRQHQQAPSAVSVALPSLVAPLTFAMKDPVIPALNLAVDAFLPHLAPLRPRPAGIVEHDPEVQPVKVLMTPLPIAANPVKALPVQPLDVPRAIVDAPNIAAPPPRHAAPEVMSAAALTPIRIRQPVYPQTALMRGEEGQVVVEFGLADDGSLQNMHVVQSEPAGIFDQAAIRAMRGWKYPAPTSATGQRRYRQTLMFVLNAAIAGRRDPSISHTGGENIRARADCQVLTGTHICRWPGDGA